MSEEIQRCKRLARVTKFEAMWLRVLRESGLDLSKPFTAVQAYRIICNGKTTKGAPLRSAPPNWNRVFALLRKSGEFERTVDTSGNSTWVASE